MTSERDLERMLRDGVRAMGGWCLKFISPGFTGVPDRILLLRGGVIAFAELKRPGQVERQRQAFVQYRLRKMGFTVFSAVDSREKIKAIISWVDEKTARPQLQPGWYGQKPGGGDYK